MATELKSYTIVPDSLYVERKADMQLHNIVETMQRPGYVLVSRQMGKTNLLLKAKRKWENDRDLYVYIDMSNVDETEKECFQSLIDTAIDTHEDILGHVRERIQDLRRTNITKSPVQAHNEELRELLKEIPRKLVFILDEIDSLTRTSFSDNVFSQIRSIYFNRVNYPVFEKLTYVLSGVVEPTEIIKNPKISPFNIGEKILLDDFSHEEYLSFIQKAGLESLGGDVIERIYYWTGGNPRMTWDVCYELQNMSVHTIETVDELVKRIYLTAFDKAPIDTIRNLVKEDRDLRDAIIQLFYEKGSTLSDKIKSKLYLSGIVNYSDNDVKIKNRIIKDSLSLSWLQKVEEEEKGLLTYAIELHSKGLYEESVQKFEIYIKNNNFPEENAPYYYYYMGSCYYHLNEFEKSLHYLTLRPIDVKLSSVDYRSENFLCGVDCLKLGRYHEALDYWDKVMNDDSRDRYYYSSKLNSLAAQTRLAHDDDKRLKEIESEYKSLLDLPDGLEIKEVKLHAAYELARMFSGDNIDAAVKYYDFALSLATQSDKPRILSEKFYVVGEEERQALIARLIDTIEKIESIQETAEPDKALGIDEDVLAQVLYIIYSYAYERWDGVKGKLSLFSKTYGDALFLMFLKSFNRTTELFSEGSSRLICELYEHYDSNEYQLSEKNVLPVFKFNAFLNYSDVHAKKYATRLKDSEEQIDSYGLVVVRSYAWELFKSNEFSALIGELEWVIDRYPKNISYLEAVPRSLFEYTLMMSYHNLYNRRASVETAQLILSHVDDDIKHTTGQNQDTLRQVKNVTMQVLSMNRSHESYISTKKYGRNDRIKVRYSQSGIVVEKKYKYLESDLRNGVCEVIIE